MTRTRRSSAENAVLSVLKATFQIFLNVLFYVIVIFVIIKAAKFASTFAYQVFGSVPVTKGVGQEKELIVTSGESTMQVANDLQTKGLIVNRYTFYVRAKLGKVNIKPGTYTISTSMDYDAIYSVLETGEKDDAASSAAVNES
jgi:UPF0755 protein